MMKERLSTELDKQGINNQLWLLAMLVAILLMPLIATFFPGGFKLIFAITYSLLVFSGIKSMSDSSRHFFFILGLGAISFVFIWISFFKTEALHLTGVKTLSLMAFFFYLSTLLFRKLASTREISIEIIFASISGYLILGIIGGLLFQALELLIPGSFKLMNYDNNLYDLHYFSFVTLTTLGFGDITPLSEAAKSLTILLSIIGQLYLTILIAILVGKYLSKSPI